MKRLIALFAALGLSLTLLSACSPTSNKPLEAQNGAPSKISVVCTNFAAYDFTRQVIGECGDRFDVNYLTGSGVDLHSYQPSVEDVASINKADLFVYVGGESDEWARDTAADIDGLHSVSLLDAIGSAAVEEELVEGMSTGHDESEGDDSDHDHATSDDDGDDDHATSDDSDDDHATSDDSDHDHATSDDDHDDTPEYDEHVWLSLKNAQIIVDAIADELGRVDPDSATTYAEHAAAYKQQLAELDKSYSDNISQATYDTLVFADRFPFRYLTEDYQLSYYAAFPGCSAETEASFDVVSFLAKKLDELGVDSVLVIEDSDQNLARTVINTSQAHNQQILVIDSLQSASHADIEAGKTYLSTMENNLSVLMDALT
ncbi:MAG: zinc ABC transporter substrate-binding protein [Atopobiaceae bacterium]|nr:zinc ABC transporter substrate-binding protein [Atopobiaceae bacterium]